jgi:multiple sugar transport system substrate-binding protein/sn-glycerol 3-phosphate transport system substrate-binding protein
MPKRFITIIICLFVTGCGYIGEFRLEGVLPTRPEDSTSGVNAKPSTTPAPESTPTPAPDSTLDMNAEQLRAVNIDFWHAWSGSAGQTVETLVAEFNRSNTWGITVHAAAAGSYDQMFEKVQAELESGALPDVATAYLYQALEWNAAKDVLLDLSTYVNDPVWGLDETTQADYYPVFWEHNLVDGKYLGIPAQGSAQMLYYNLTWAAELGFNQPPATPEELMGQACASTQAYLRDNDPKNDHKGGWIIATGYSAALGWIYAYGGEVSTPDGYDFNNPQVAAAFNFIRSLYDNGCAWLSESQTLEAEFAGRLGLFVAGSASGIPVQEDAFVQLGSQDDWAVIPFPSPDGKPVISAYGPSFQILKSTPEEQLAAWLFVRWMTEPERQAQLAQVSGFYPVRASSLGLMGVLPAAHPQWKTAAELLENARPEPKLRSWRIARWAVSDAVTQLYRYYFEPTQVNVLIKLLDDTADDLENKLP